MSMSSDGHDPGVQCVYDGCNDIFQRDGCQEAASWLMGFGRLYIEGLQNPYTKPSSPQTLPLQAHKLPRPKNVSRESFFQARHVNPQSRAEGRKDQTTAVFGVRDHNIGSY